MTYVLRRLSVIVQFYYHHRSTTRVNIKNVYGCGTNNDNEHRDKNIGFTNMGKTIATKKTGIENSSAIHSSFLCFSSSFLRRARAAPPPVLDRRSSEINSKERIKQNKETNDYAVLSDHAVGIC